MATYVVLYRFTDQGLKNIKGTVKRADEVRKANEARGFKVQGIYWTQGHYDMVAIMDAPDDESMVAGLFNVAEAGNVHSETLRAYSSQEMEAILSKA
jgi:uncharacterized protein with GYD domain